MRAYRQPPILGSSPLTATLRRWQIPIGACHFSNSLLACKTFEGPLDCGEGVFHRSIGSAGFRDEVGIELVVIYLGLVQSFDKLFGVRRQPIVVLVLSHPGIKLVLILRCRGLSLDIVGIIVGVRLLCCDSSLRCCSSLMGARMASLHRQTSPSGLVLIIGILFFGINFGLAIGIGIAVCVVFIFHAVVGFGSLESTTSSSINSTSRLRMILPVLGLYSDVDAVVRVGLRRYIHSVEWESNFARLPLVTRLRWPCIRMSDGA